MDRMKFDDQINACCSTGCLIIIAILAAPFVWGVIAGILGEIFGV